ncbi:MAG: glucose-1-phosphate thymidylyltransferase [Gemmatimonadota bacterium]|nr:glucose-1-phosphate thymidylyltransferase [Gemmatimonadota bacterium]MDP6529412.1 glucose-1-phosphate thymidylyltransferase [Gemmatimonadota bacterium]MDP6802713.1 glucose-1-phosphate thymidylyltransferase [Gemmatimonadota bacterium]
MKGLILSGGKGTRLRPITHTSAKQLVPVANKPILFFAIEAVRDAGVEEIGIVVGETGAEIRAAVGDGSAFGVKITYIPQENPLGLAHAVKVSRDFLGEDPFVMFLGDNLIKDGITPLVDEFRRDGPNSQILLASVPNPSEFGVAEIADGKVVGLEEKPAQPKSEFALVGVYMFDRSIHEAVDNIQPSARGELEITDAIQYLIDHDFDVRSHVIRGWWKDTGKLEDMLEANRIVLSSLERRIDGEVDDRSRIIGEVVVGKGARVENSELRGPLILGEGAVVKDSYVGPFTSISDQCEVLSSEVEFSIILKGGRVHDLDRRMEGSLVGRNATILSSAVRPRAYRFMVGDNSEVRVPR